MKDQQDYIKDIAEIRTMMERSTKFLSLSGWAGIMAGIYALAGAWIAYSLLGFHPDAISYSTSHLPQLVMLAIAILIIALLTAVFFSWKKARNRGHNIWNATSRRLLVHMAFPLITGGILILAFTSKGLIGIVCPLMLVFYGLALYNAGNYTINEVRLMGLIQIVLGLVGAWHIEYGLLLWTLGFGVVHLVYGVYMYVRYEQ